MCIQRISGKQFVYPQMFKVSGQMYHCMGNVEPYPGQAPEFSQLYVYDQQHELDNQMKNVPVWIEIYWNNCFKFCTKTMNG